MQNIILLHGALGSSKDLEHLTGLLKNSGFSVHTFSFSGHGGTPFAANFGIEQFAAELKDYIHRNKLEKPDVFGFSMGGYVSLYLAGKEPGLLNRIVTLGTKFEWNDGVIEKQKKFLDPALIAKNPSLEQQLKNVHGAELHRLLKETEKMLHQIAHQKLLNPDFFSKITNPVLIGIADKDYMVSLEETVFVYKNIASAGMYMLPNSKHPIESSNFGILSAIIKDFTSGS